MPYLLEMKSITKRFGAVKAVDNVSLRLNPGEVVSLCGENGSGKSTLMKVLCGIYPHGSYEGEIVFAGEVIQGEYLFTGYFEQESTRHNTNTAIEEVWQEYPGMTNFEVRAALARCGLTNEHITSQVMVLSGGESAKVRLCKLMLKDINWLVLDEPTNHLDVEAKAELKRALQEFKGTVLLVSHEPEFYEDWVTHIWNVEDWTTKIV